MDELTKRASDSATRFAELSQTIKDAEKRMAEIAAKDAFGLLEGGVPKLKALNQEYSELLKKKKDAYAEYRRIKEENKELQMAKHNLERFLDQQEEEQKQKAGYFIGIDSGGVPRFLCSSVAQQCVAPMISSVQGY